MIRLMELHWLFSALWSRKPNISISAGISEKVHLLTCCTCILFGQCVWGKIWDVLVWLSYWMPCILALNQCHFSKASVFLIHADGPFNLTTSNQNVMFSSQKRREEKKWWNCEKQRHASNMTDVENRISLRQDTMDAGTFLWGNRLLR